jgi:hypothetical protein
MNRLAYALVGAAAANVTLHRRIDLSIVRFGDPRQQGFGGHHLARLTVPTLGNINVQPGLLDVGQGACLTRKVLNGGDGLVLQAAHWHQTGPGRLTINVDGARAAEP